MLLSTVLYEIIGRVKLVLVIICNDCVASTMNEFYYNPFSPENKTFGHTSANCFF